MNDDREQRESEREGLGNYTQTKELWFLTVYELWLNDGDNKKNWEKTTTTRNINHTTGWLAGCLAYQGEEYK